MSRLRIAILDDYQNVALSLGDWTAVQAKADIDVFRDTILDENDLIKRLEPYEIICTMRERTKFTAQIFKRLPKLKLVTTTGPINRGIDSEAAAAHGVIVVGTSGFGNATFEHIWALILAVARQIVVEDANVKAGNPQWQSTIPVDLHGRTLSLLGVGRLGSRVAQVAKIFGMRVLAWSPNLTKERADAAGVELASSKEELLKQADLFSIHMVLAPSTKHLVNRADLALLKPTALFFNTSRGPIVDEEALIEVLSKGKIAGAGLDVFDTEPLPLDHPIRKLKNVVLTPHTAYIGDQNYKIWWRDSANNVATWLEGKELNPKLVLTKRT